MYTLTLKDIKDIFDAGVRRGCEEASSYEWGSTPWGHYYDELVEVMFDILNENYLPDQEGFTNWTDLEKLIKNA
jgi:hypothetical protein